MDSLQLEFSFSFKFTKVTRMRRAVIQKRFLQKMYLLFLGIITMYFHILRHQRMVAQGKYRIFLDFPIILIRNSLIHLSFLHEAC